MTDKVEDEDMPNASSSLLTLQHVVWLEHVHAADDKEEDEDKNEKPYEDEELYERGRSSFDWSRFLA
jgi:hypothetical protein